MTKNELAREVSVSEKLHLPTTVKAIDGVFRLIKETIAKVAERTARNFKTGDSVTIPAHKSIKLRPSKELVKTFNKED